MPVELHHIRELLLPGLMELASTQPAAWDKVFLAPLKGEGASIIFDAAAPLPTVSLPVAVAMGAAAAVIKNPVVSRRLWKK